MKKPLFIIFNDSHLKTGNEKEVENAFNYMVDYAVENKIERLIFAGDMFDSRSFQRQECLQTLRRMLKRIDSKGLFLDWFPGNHDKTIYASYDSFLDTYEHYPSTRFHRKLSVIEIEGVSISLLPFFSDDMLIPMLEEAEGTDILISHFEMAGSTHLGKTSKKTSINQKLLSKWKKTYLGHYHNWHEISKDIVHLPSFIQASFGEDANKGFSVIYDDLSYEIIKGRFREFKKLSIDIEQLDNAKVKEIIEAYSNSEDTIRLEITGDENRLKAFDKTRFANTGIDVKVKYDKKFDFKAEDLKMPTVVEYYGKDQVREAFAEFCKNKDYDHEQGLKFLEKFLEQK